MIIIWKQVNVQLFSVYVGVVVNVDAWLSKFLQIVSSVGHDSELRLWRKIVSFSRLWVGLFSLPERLEKADTLAFCGAIGWPLNLLFPPGLEREEEFPKWWWSPGEWPTTKKRRTRGLETACLFARLLIILSFLLSSSWTEKLERKELAFEKKLVILEVATDLDERSTNCILAWFNLQYWISLWCRCLADRSCDTQLFSLPIHPS